MRAGVFSAHMHNAKKESIILHVFQTSPIPHKDIEFVKKNENKKIKKKSCKLHTF